MAHALIIDNNLAVSRAIQRYLEPMGFRSFDHTWTEDQAFGAATRQRPDIIIIGDDIETGSAIDAARRISTEASIPVLMVSGDPVQASRRLAQVSSYTGPFLINEIDAAIAVALAGKRDMMAQASG